MAEDLAEVIKKYVKEAIHEYFRDIWREFEGEELPYPPLPKLFHQRYFRRYRDLYDRFDSDVKSLSHSIQFLREFAIKKQDWNDKCSEKEKIEKLTEDVKEIKEAMNEIRDLLKRIASK